MSNPWKRTVDDKVDEAMDPQSLFSIHINAIANAINEM
jgi:hypothetical protein